MRARCTRRITILLAAIAAILISLTPNSAPAASVEFSGVVRTAAGKPVAAASVTLSRQGVSETTQSDVRGRFHLQVAMAGAYLLTIRAQAFLPYHQFVEIPNAHAIDIVLEASALPVIGSVTGVARAPFNATPLAQRIFPREAYRDQGQPATTTVLDQTPGALVARSTSVNDAAPLAPANPLVRGGLPFETPVLLDGAPLSLPSTGTFDISLIPTYVLQEVEVLQGPGDPAGAGSGVGGALNLRTAEPTLPIRGMLEVEGDSQGGQFSDLAYDGTVPGGKFAFATMASIDGSAGPLHGMTFALPGSGAGTCCAAAVPSNALRKALLLKLRMTPNPSLTVTASFLGVNLERALAAEYGVLLPDDTYAGLVPSLDTTQYESLRFAQVQARLDHGSDGFDARLYGVDLANSTQSGLPGIVSNGQDRERGGGITWHHQAAHNLFSLALLDSSGNASQNDVYALPVAAGSSLNALRLRASAALHPDSADELDLSAEAGSLREWAAPTTAGFKSYAWTPSAARVGYAHLLRPRLSLRGALGFSTVAPPLMALSSGPTVTQEYVGFPSRTVSFASDVTQLERATGADVGVEWRLHGETTTFSADWYESSTHAAYVLENQPQGSGIADRWFNGPPMRDAGVLFSLVQFKPIGMGFIAQMAFPRTYVVGSLSPGFYSGGNLAILPGQNIAGGAFFAPGENDVAPIRLPYAQGYGEISYKWPRGSRLSLGMLYEGSNNPYAQPAFATFNSNLELSLGPKAKFQISVEN
ncbi:MAG TPA: TonB-dependent receptor, partial [Candidatus Cybelea sp.]|nr:TonB-dependent receptor [Candidatus Cybelea sp.]